MADRHAVSNMKPTFKYDTRPPLLRQAISRKSTPSGSICRSRCDRQLASGIQPGKVQLAALDIPHRANSSLAQHDTLVGHGLRRTHTLLFLSKHGQAPQSRTGHYRPEEQRHAEDSDTRLQWLLASIKREPRRVHQSSEPALTGADGFLSQALRFGRRYRCPVLLPPSRKRVRASIAR